MTSIAAQPGGGTLSGWVIPPLAAEGSAAVRSVSRILSFADLGYADGIDFGALEGEREFYFPVSSGPWLQAMRLVLPYQSGSVVAAERSLTVRCFDRRTVGEYLKLAAAGGLQLDVRNDWPMTVASLTGLLPRDPVVTLPPTPDASRVAVALTVVASRRGGRIVVGPFVPETPEQDIVEIAGATAPALSVKRRDGLPILVVGGNDPAAAVRLAFSSWNDLLRTPSVADGGVASRELDALKFADVGADFRPVAISEGMHEWAIGIPAGRLPPGTRLKGVSVALAVPFVPDGRAAGGVLSAWVNGTMIGSVPLAAAGVTTLRADVPKGASRAINYVKLRIDRETRHEDCGEVSLAFPPSCSRAARCCSNRRRRCSTSATSSPQPAAD